MGKIKLQVDAIVVASFEAAASAESRQAVLATPTCNLTEDDSCWCSERYTCLCG